MGTDNYSEWRGPDHRLISSLVSEGKFFATGKGSRLLGGSASAMTLVGSHHVGVKRRPTYQMKKGEGWLLELPRTIPGFVAKSPLSIHGVNQVAWTAAAFLCLILLIFGVGAFTGGFRLEFRRETRAAISCWTARDTRCCAIVMNRGESR